MKALEELTREIREKLPRLMELKDGQRIIALKSDEPNDIYVGDIDTIGISAILLESGEIEIGGYEYQIGVDYGVVGLEPMLNDVLEWLGLMGVEYISYDGQLYIYKEIETGFIWDLSKPYLKDQSPELITFLHSLLKTKQ